MLSNKQLFSAKLIKGFAAIDSNVHDEDVMVSAKVIQDEWVLPVICDDLFCKLAGMDCPTDPVTPYDVLRLTYILPVIAWGVRADIEPQLHNKVRNAGLIRASDERIANVSQNEMKENMLRYENRMKFYLDRLKDYLKENRADFPEWQDCEKSCECVCSTNSSTRGKIVAGIYLDK